MFRVAIVFVMVMFSSVGFAQDVVTVNNRVDAPAVGKRDRPIRINHPEGAKVQAIYANTDQGVVRWSFLPEDHFERTPKFTIFVAPPGDFLITTGDSTILRIVEELQPGPQPRPQPQPEPQPRPQPEPPAPEPQPSPGPTGSVAWAVWVYEQADSVNQIPQTNTRLSIETRRYLESLGIKMVAYDGDQDAAKAKPFRDAAKSLPALVLMQDANRYTTFPAPKSIDELKRLVREVGGE
jgi:hypothetical protein